MPLGVYQVTADVTVPQGSVTGLPPGNGSTVFWDGKPSGHWATAFDVTFRKGQIITLDNTTGGGQALFHAIGPQNLTQIMTESTHNPHAGVTNS